MALMADALRNQLLHVSLYMNARCPDAGGPGDQQQQDQQQQQQGNWQCVCEGGGGSLAGTCSYVAPVMAAQV
jgi:hypothetical protein